MLIAQRYFFSELSCALGLGAAQAWLEENVSTSCGNDSGSLNFPEGMIHESKALPPLVRQKTWSSLPKGTPSEDAPTLGRQWSEPLACGQVLNAGHKNMSSVALEIPDVDSDTASTQAWHPWDILSRNSRSSAHFNRSFSKDKRGLLFTDAAHLVLDTAKK